MKTKTWIVVKVERGFPAGLIVCKDKKDALRQGRREFIKQNKDYDSLGIFCVDFGKEKVEQPVIGSF